eukprot:Colp12_sorted_trinity150504_noHs@20132
MLGALGGCPSHLRSVGGVNDMLDGVGGKEGALNGGNSPDLTMLAGGGFKGGKPGIDSSIGNRWLTTGAVRSRGYGGSAEYLVGSGAALLCSRNHLSLGAHVLCVD